MQHMIDCTPVHVESLANFYHALNNGQAGIVGSRRHLVNGDILAFCISVHYVRECTADIDAD